MSAILPFILDVVNLFIARLTSSIFRKARNLLRRQKLSKQFSESMLRKTKLEIHMKTLLLLATVLFSMCQTITAQSYSDTGQGQPKDILETAKSYGSLNQFVAMAGQSGMAKMLEGSEHLTIFAFSDQAFAKLPLDLSRALLQQPRLFWQVLSHYATHGDLVAGDLVEDKSVKSLAGEILRWDRKDGKLRVQYSEVERSDIMCVNGVIHIINSLDVAYVQQILKRSTQKSLPS